MTTPAFTTVAGITVICYLIGTGVKLSPLPDRFIPLICGLCGALLGLAGMRLMPDFPAQNVIDALAAGATSGLAATGANETVRQLARRDGDT